VHFSDIKLAVHRGYRAEINVHDTEPIIAYLWRISIRNDLDE